MRVLQVANVGNIVGGTAACAWSLVQALPECEHGVLFFSEPTEETRRALAGCEIGQIGRLELGHVRRFGADVVVLHNTPAHRVLGEMPALVVLYHHSRTARAGRREERGERREERGLGRTMFHGEERCADVELYCSRWLAAQCGADERLVCWQGVPAPEGALVGRERRNAAREVGAELVVGRLCTPQARKWPALLAGFYRDLAQRVPETRWEFVGCPAGLQRELHEACGGRVRFLPAGWQARAHLWRWDAMLYHNPELAESFGRVCAEAMLAGCVPLVDRSGGFVEQVAQGCGYLCDGVEEFAAALEALRDARRRAETAARARAHAERHFSLAAFGERMLEWLEAGAATA